MPIYEYRCEKGHNFEVMQRMSDDPVLTCETCEAPVQRVFRPVAVHFKGSGFYNTDYGTRKRSRENAEHAKNNGDGSKSGEGAKSGEGSKGGEGAKGGEGKSEKKTESKSEKKSDTKAKASSD
jgi:putative FmdB family regulatory protein